ncbi:hypothetical protein C772_01428 [Bhargavaea cecembensis DSE10]|uniref:Uncharacterized protein n=1 Tax=Bhargavaea cecembensis DSE10 TaxID=1235279 RepID=M7ND80_9BACL|nr:hypothetical protein C772_01428 [Bhargavaea cecembensis DSE10]
MSNTVESAKKPSGGNRMAQRTRRRETCPEHMDQAKNDLTIERLFSNGGSFFLC